MDIASSFSTTPDTVEALKAAYTDLENKLGGSPTWLAVHATYQHSGEVITATLQTLAPNVPFQGGTSCLGLMTETGFHSDKGTSLGSFGIRDPEGIYGIGYAEAKAHSRRAGYTAITNALQNAEKTHHLPWSGLPVPRAMKKEFWLVLKKDWPEQIPPSLAEVRRIIPLRGNGISLPTARCCIMESL